MGGTNRQRDTTSGAPSLTGPAPGSERRHGFRAVGVAVSKLAAPIVSKRGSGILVRLKAEWGAIIASGQSDLLSAWWISTLPGLFVVVVGMGLALTSEGLAERFRVQMK